MLFDGNKRLIEMHFYAFGYQSNDPRSSYRSSGREDGIDNWLSNPKDWDYKVMVKKSNEHWSLYHFGEREREIKFDENTEMIYKKTDSAFFLRKKNTIYYKNYPVLIYKY